MLRHITLQTGSIYAVVIQEDKWIHLLKDWETEFVIQAEEVVKVVELSSSSEDQPLPSLWVWTADNAVWQVSPSHLRALHPSDSHRVQDDHDTSEDIFDDLPAENLDAFDVAQPAWPNALPLSTGRLVWKESGIQSLAATQHCLMLAVTDGSGALSLRLLQVPGKAEESVTLASTWTMPDCSLGLDARYWSEGEGWKFYFVVSGSQNASSCTVMLNSQLFVRLFGVDASLMDTPVLLACSRDGLVFHRPLCSLDAIPDRREPSLWALLCDAGGPVQDILVMPLPKTDRTRGGGSHHPEDPDSMTRKEALCVVTSLGKVTLLSVSSGSGTDTAVPRAFGDLQSPPLIHTWSGTLCSSVLASSSEGSALYYSSGKGVMRSTLTLDCPVWEGDVISEMALTDFVAFRKNSSGSTEVKLACLTSSGKVVQVKARSCPPESSSPAASIKAALLGLHSQGRLLESLDSQAQDRTAYLRQLQIAAHLMTSTAAGSRPPAASGSSVRCKVEVKSQERGYKVDFGLNCRLENHLGLQLSPDWSVAVTVCHDRLEDSTFLTHSLRLSHGLADGDSFVTWCPLSASLLGDCTVQVKLILHAPDWLSSLPESCKLLPAQCDQQGLMVSVATETLDAVHFLHRHRPGPSPGAGGPVPTSSHGHIHSLSVTVPPAALPSNSLQLSDTDECTVILRLLLRGSQLPVLERGQCEASDWKGRSLTLNVHKENGTFQPSASKSDFQGRGPGVPTERDAKVIETATERFQIVLRSEHLSLLADVRKALLRRLQVMVSQSGKAVQVSYRGPQLKKYLTALRGCLEECRRAEKEDDADSRLQKLYKDCRVLECPL